MLSERRYRSSAPLDHNVNSRTGAAIAVAQVRPSDVRQRCSRAPVSRPDLAVAERLSAATSRPSDGRPFSLELSWATVVSGNGCPQYEVDRLIELAGDLVVADEPCRHQGAGERHLQCGFHRARPAGTAPGDNPRRHIPHRRADPGLGCVVDISMQWKCA